MKRAGPLFSSRYFASGGRIFIQKKHGVVCKFVLIGSGSGRTSFP